MPANLAPVQTVPAARVREKIVEVPVNNGQEKAALMREVDPHGAIVVHAVKKSSYVHDRLHALGRIDNDLYDAAERFRKDFERGELKGHFASIDMFRSSGGSRGEISDNAAEARIRIRGALASLGARRSGKSWQQSCVWFVVGCGDTLEQWALRMRTSGDNMSEAKAAGILCGALESLALHYGTSTPNSIKERASGLAYTRGRIDERESNIAHMQLAALDPQMSLAKFAELLKNKVANSRNSG